MAIINSCCFFKNVWNGSLATAIYTLIYFAFTSLILLIYISDEWDYIVGRRKKPIGETIIEKGVVTETLVILNIIDLICAICLVIASFLLMYGLKKDKREYLLPWILLMFLNIFLEFICAVYFIISKRSKFDPVVGFIFTIDLFVVSLNLYCLVCVISQYQEYKQSSYRRHNTDEQHSTIIPLQHSSLSSTLSTQVENDSLNSSNISKFIKVKSQLQKLHKPNVTQSILVNANQFSTISPIPEEENSHTNL